MKPKNIQKEVYDLLDQARPAGPRSFSKRKLAIAAGLAVLAIPGCGFG